MMTFHDKQISMSHGAGGEASRRLVEGLIRPLLSNAWLNPLADAAILPAPTGKLAVTTDSFVVQPLKFPGGSIGELAIHGTVNDLAVSGAPPHRNHRLVDLGGRPTHKRASRRNRRHGRRGRASRRSGRRRRYEGR